MTPEPLVMKAFERIAKRFITNITTACRGLDDAQSWHHTQASWGSCYTTVCWVLLCLQHISTTHSWQTICRTIFIFDHRFIVWIMECCDIMLQDPTHAFSLRLSGSPPAGTHQDVGLTDWGQPSYHRTSASLTPASPQPTSLLIGLHN